MLEAKTLWLICGGGFVLLAIAGIALGTEVWIQRQEIRKLRRDMVKCVVRIIDLEKADVK